MAPTCTVTRLHADTIRVDRTAPPPGSIVAFLMRFRDRRGQLGWRLDARVPLRAPRPGLWPAPDDAIAALGVMSRSEARTAIAAAGAPAPKLAGTPAASRIGDGHARRRRPRDLFDGAPREARQDEAG